MRPFKSILLASFTAVLGMTPALAEAPAAATTVTAAAIEWPVVRAPAAPAFHMAPGVSEATAAPPAAAPAPPPEPTLTVAINLSTQRMTVSENGNAKYTWPVSTARAGYRTPTGTFKPTWMSKMWYSRQYDMSPMPHSVFFSGGVAIHATYATGMLGRPASHGCVRLAPKNAATFYAMVNKHGKSKTRIAVHGVPRRDPAIASNRRKQQRYAFGPNGYGVQGPGYSSQRARPYYPAQVSGQYYVPNNGRRQRLAQRAPARRGYGNGYGY